MRKKCQLTFSYFAASSEVSSNTEAVWLKAFELTVPTVHALKVTTASHLGVAHFFLFFLLLFFAILAKKVILTFTRV